MNKKIILTIIFALFITTSVYAVDYTVTTGDSIMVVGVELTKDTNNPTHYFATLTADLNYKDYANPFLRGQYVKQYYWNNWWDTTMIGDLFTGSTTTTAIFDPATNTTTLVDLPDYYVELPDVSSSDRENCQITTDPNNPEYTTTNVPCADVVPSTRAGFYGLPFYIEYAEFYCDVNNPTKGHIILRPKAGSIDMVTLSRPSYPTISGPNIVGNDNVPLGFLVNDKMVRLPPATRTDCYNMDTTNNSAFILMLKPNPLYRHTNPLTTGSETWSYSDIITGLSSLTNKDTLPFKLYTTFNYAGNWWNYTITNNKNDTYIDNFYQTFFSDSNMNDMDCIVDARLLPQSFFAQVFYDVRAQFGDNVQKTYRLSELLAFDSENGNNWFASNINTGKGVTCNYIESKAINTINDVATTNIEDSISIDLQARNVQQLDMLNKKLDSKRFFAKNLIPYFCIVIIMMFYMFQILVIGFLCFAVLPIMFRQFLKGVKDAFDTSELKRLR